MTSHSKTARAVRRVTILLCLGTAGCARLVGAQQPDDIGSPGDTRRSCGAAARALVERASPAAMRQALLRVQTCPDEGPTSITSLLQTPPADSGTRDLVFAVSGNVRDRRVLSALADMASDRTRATALRKRAIASMASLYDGRLSARLTTRPGSAGSSVTVELLRLAHDQSHAGAQPLPPDARAQILALLDRVSLTDEDAAVRNVSASLATQLRATVAP
jgi:hypothetical protein